MLLLRGEAHRPGIGARYGGYRGQPVTPAGWRRAGQALPPPAVPVPDQSMRRRGISPTAQALEADRAVTPCRGTEPARQVTARNLRPGSPVPALDQRSCGLRRRPPRRSGPRQRPPRPADPDGTSPPEPPAYPDAGTADAGTAAAGRAAVAGFTAEHPAITDATGSMMTASAPALAQRTVASARCHPFQSRLLPDSIPRANAGRRAHIGVLAGSARNPHAVRRHPRPELLASRYTESPAPVTGASAHRSHG